MQGFARPDKLKLQDNAFSLGKWGEKFSIAVGRSKAIAHFMKTIVFLKRF